MAKSKIADDEEGSVIYLIGRDLSNPNNDKVLSLSKLKTLEYRLFRKMREKLKNYYRDKKGDSNNLVNRFRKESKDLVGESELPKPLDFYIALF